MNLFIAISSVMWGLWRALILCRGNLTTIEAAIFIYWISVGYFGLLVISAILLRIACCFCLNTKLMSLIASSTEDREKYDMTRAVQTSLGFRVFLRSWSADRLTANNKTKYIAVNEEQCWNWSELDWNQPHKTPPTHPNLHLSAQSS